MLLTPKVFEIFIPTERVKMFSLSSFAVWRFTSEKERWENGRIHWSLLGTYWSED